MVPISTATPSTDTASVSRRNRSIGLDTERAAISGLAFLITYATVKSVLAAAHKPFWNDEMATWAMVHQPNLAAVWRALKHVADSNPPGFYLMERLVTRFLSNEEIALRLPSIVGFCCVLLCLFIFVRRRSGSISALVCASAVFVTGLYDFSVEARPYSLVVACVSIALVCYQRAPARRWMLLMALIFAVSQTLHYYAVLGLVPFALAEAAWSLKTSRVRLNVWLAFLGGLFPLAVFSPLLFEVRRSLGSHFWAKPSLLGVGETYTMFFQMPGIVVAAAAAIGILYVLALPDAPDNHLNIKKEAPFHEYVLILGLLSLPFVGFTVAKLAHGGMTGRYVIPAVLGVPLTAGYLLPRLKRRSAALFTIFIVFAVAFHETSFWYSRNPLRSQLVSPATHFEHLWKAAGTPDLPVVVSNAVKYMPLVHYAQPEMRMRFFVLLDASKALDHAGSDSVDLGLANLRSYIPLQAYDLSTFALEHRVFLLYSHCTDRFDWWPSELARQGYSLQFLAGDRTGTLYLVNTKVQLR